MEDTVKQRIILALKECGMSINAVSKITGYPQSNLNKQINGNTSMSLKTLLALLDSIPLLSAEWLLRGEGEMYKTQSEDSSMAANMQTMYEFLLEDRDRKIREMEAELYLYKTQHSQKRKEA